jgi:hypothetical protein
MGGGGKWLDRNQWRSILRQSGVEWGCNTREGEEEKGEKEKLEDGEQQEEEKDGPGEETTL